jgi:hypothetical protein
MYLSLSRGAWLAVVAGAAVLIICSPTRGAASLTVLTVSLFATLAILKLSTALVDNPYAQPGQVVAGHAYLPKLAAFALLAGVIQAILVRAERTVRSSPTLVLAGRRIRVAVACLAAVGAIGALGLAGTAIDGKLGNVGGFISRQWNDFLHPASAPGAGTARLISAKTTRGDVYRVALDEFKAHPLFGGGSGSYATSWYAQRRYAESLQNAHSLYLETLAELGIAGAAILLAFLGSCVWTAVRSRSRPTALSRGQATAVMASTSVWAIHAGVDWDWQMSALTGLALFLVGTLFPLGARSSELEMQDESARPVRRRRRGGAWRSALRSGRHGLRSAAAALDGRGVTAARIAGVLCAFAAVYSWGSAQQAQRLQDANGLGAAGQYRAALREARSVTLSPASDQALVVEAFALQDLRHLRAAGATYAAAAAANPGDWTIRLNWAQDLAQQHRRAAARAQLRQVLRLNPLVILPPDLARLVSGGR